jgi:hypothetical protein
MSSWRDRVHYRRYLMRRWCGLRVYSKRYLLMDLEKSEDHRMLAEVRQVVDIMSRSPSENAREYAKTLGEILNGDKEPRG